VITHLLNEGLLAVLPGTGTVVAELPRSTAAERSRLLENEVEQLVVEAKRLGLSLHDVTSSLGRHWRRLDSQDADHDPVLTGVGKRK
jgi:GntR family transcriptional regulator